MKNLMATIALVAAQSRHEFNTGKIFTNNKQPEDFNIWSQCWDPALNFCECRWSIGGGDSGNCEMSTGKLTLYFPEDPNNARVMLATNSFGWSDEPDARTKYAENDSLFVWGDFLERGLLGAFLFAVRATVLKTAADGEIREAGHHALGDGKFGFARGGEARNRFE